MDEVKTIIVAWGGGVKKNRFFLGVKLCGKKRENHTLFRKE